MKEANNCERYHIRCQLLGVQDDGWKLPVELLAYLLVSTRGLSIERNEICDITWNLEGLDPIVSSRLPCSKCFLDEYASSTNDCTKSIIIHKKLSIAFFFLKHYQPSSVWRLGRGDMIPSKNWPYINCFRRKYCFQ
jgi:hypothetical protein